MYRYKLATNWQSFTEIYLAQVKISQGLLFLFTLYVIATCQLTVWCVSTLWAIKNVPRH